MNCAEIVVYDNVYDDAEMYDAGKVLIYVSLAAPHKLGKAVGTIRSR